MASNNDYTRINNVTNMKIVDNLEASTNPEDFICVLNSDAPGGQMDLRLDSVVKMYLEPVE